MISTDKLLTVKEASEWATKYLGKNVTTSNISYLIQYARIRKIGENGMAQVSQQELLNYYKSYNGKREVSWKNQLGEDLNWDLSFDQYKEAETTKHVHRLHPYKGKFIPQLVEYFLDSHIDKFKKQAYFKKDDIVLDPFAGSGTTMVQACELGMHAIVYTAGPEENFLTVRDLNQTEDLELTEQTEIVEANKRVQEER